MNIAYKIRHTFPNNMIYNRIRFRQRQTLWKEGAQNHRSKVHTYVPWRLDYLKYLEIVVWEEISVPLANLKEEVDLEWVLLIKEAREVGISKEEILKFLTRNGNPVSEKESRP